MLFTQLLGQGDLEVAEEGDAKHEKITKKPMLSHGFVLISLKISAFTEPNTWNGTLKSR